MILATISAAAIAACPEIGRRLECVVDSDTIWHEGVKVRLEGIDGPEISEPQCEAERAKGEAAKRRLIQLMRGGYRVHYSGKLDRYGRALGSVIVREGDAGEVLLREGLARRWGGKRLPWCAIGERYAR